MLAVLPVGRQLDVKMSLNDEHSWEVNWELIDSP